MAKAKFTEAEKADYKKGMKTVKENAKDYAFSYCPTTGVTVLAMRCERENFPEKPSHQYTISVAYCNFTAGDVFSRKRGRYSALKNHNYMVILSDNSSAQIVANSARNTLSDLR